MFELLITVKKYQTTVSMTEHYYTLFVVCVVIENTRRQQKRNKNIQKLKVGLAVNGSKGLSYY